MIICISIDVPLHAGHDVLFGISTFLIWKVNGCFIIH